MSAVIKGLNNNTEAKGVHAEVVGKTPDGRGLLVEFDLPLNGGSKRRVAYAKAGVGGAAGLAGGINTFRIGARVVVSAEFRKDGLARVTSIRSR